MGSARLYRFSRVCILTCLSLGAATAGTFSFNGVFSQDDQHELFTFTAPSASVTLRTYGYAGDGGLIQPGGFDPWLTLFDSTGGLQASSPWVAENDNGACGDVLADPVSGNCLDSFLLLTNLMPTHQYTLVLTQADNSALGPLYGDGFLRDGDPNFTTANGCGGTTFCDQYLEQRTGAWAVEISGVRTAVDSSAPEPASVFLLAAGCGGLLLLKRRRNLRQS